MANPPQHNHPVPIIVQMVGNGTNANRGRTPQQRIQVQTIFLPPSTPSPTENVHVRSRKSYKWKLCVLAFIVIPVGLVAYFVSASGDHSSSTNHYHGGGGGSGSSNDNYNPDIVPVTDAPHFPDCYTHFNLSLDSSKSIDSTTMSPFNLSPDYSDVDSLMRNLYPDQDCVWTFTGPESARLFLTFSVDAIGCDNLFTAAQCVNGKSYLEIRDGNTNNDKLFDKFCFKQGKTRMASSGNSLYLKLRNFPYKSAYTDLCSIDVKATVNIATKENDICSINYGENAATVITEGPVVCGEQAIAPISERIVGGREAIPHSWPWQVVLKKLDVTMCNHKFICGGSIISNQWILTAAHCVFGYFEGDFEVVAGIHNRISDTGKHYQAVEVHMHQGYNPGTFAHDIALIKLDRPIEFDMLISPVCLPTAPLPDHKGAIITGWGLTEEIADAILDGKTEVWHLNQALVHVIPWKECTRDLRKVDQITKNMFCAGERVGGKDSCQGDSGGPLVSKAENEETWIQYGITSFGQGCGEEGKPGVYTQVVNYLDWIANITKGGAMNNETMT